MIKDTNITIMVSDMDKSVSFYQSIGFTLKNRWGNHYAQLSANGVNIGLHPTSQSVKDSGSISIGFTADNFDSVRESLESLNTKTEERNDEGGQFIHFADPDGTALYFIKPKW